MVRGNAKGTQLSDYEQYKVTKEDCCDKDRAVLAEETCSNTITNVAIINGIQFSINGIWYYPVEWALSIKTKSQVLAIIAAIDTIVGVGVTWAKISKISETSKLAIEEYCKCAKYKTNF